jgi:hypothetical protein
MRLTRLTSKQAESLRDLIRPMLHFLLKCRRRLEARNFDEQSAIFQAVDKAHSAIHSLHVELIYQACGRGVGEPSAERSEVKPPEGHAPEPPSHPGA